MNVKFPAFKPINIKNDVDVSITVVPISCLKPDPSQPRKSFSLKSLEELSQSIRQHGVISPILVRKLGEETLQIIAGERRWRAAKAAGLKEIPVVLRDTDEAGSSVLALVENLLRDDLSPLEEAAALKDLSERHGMTHEHIAKSVGRSRASISNSIRLLNLIPQVQQYLFDKKIDVGHAKLLLSLEEDAQEELASEIIERGLTVRQAEQRLAAKRRHAVDGIEDEVHQDPYAEKTALWTEYLTERFSKKVSVKINQKGEGKVTIHFSAPEEVEQLIEQLGD